MEYLQLHPYQAIANGPIVPRVGIGDLFSSGANPTEALDVYKGRVRVRELPTQPSTTWDKVMVVDDNGVMHWRPFTDFQGIASCDWEVVTYNNVAAAWRANGTNGTCPEVDDLVGIGTSGPAAKLDVLNDRSSTGTGMAAKIKHIPASGSAGIGALIEVAPMAGEPKALDNYGVKVLSRNATRFNYGTHIENWTDDASINGHTSKAIYADNTVKNGAMYYGFGLHAKSVAEPSTGGSLQRSYGIFAESNNAALHNYGIYATAVGAGATNWAGWFQGNVTINGMGYLAGGVAITSDANLKTNVQPLTTGSQLISQLEPKTYDFLTNDFPTINLPPGPQLGLIAQDVEAVLPDLVHEVTVPAELDSLGAVVHPAETIKTLDYIGLIPVLISAVKEQQTIIDQQTQRLDQMEQQLSLCCIDIGTVDPRSEHEGTDLNGIGRSDLSIVPNPFTERTTVSYVLAQAGQMQLQVASNTGRKLFTLQEGWRDAGEHTYDWVTSDLAPGMYFVTLLLDGEPQMKKAVKVE